MAHHRHDSEHQIRVTEDASTGAVFRFNGFRSARNVRQRRTTDIQSKTNQYDSQNQIRNDHATYHFVKYHLTRQPSDGIHP